MKKIALLILVLLLLLAGCSKEEKPAELTAEEKRQLADDFAMLLIDEDLPVMECYYNDTEANIKVRIKTFKVGQAKALLRLTPELAKYEEIFDIKRDNYISRPDHIDDARPIAFSSKAYAYKVTAELEDMGYNAYCIPAEDESGKEIIQCLDNDTYEELKDAYLFYGTVVRSPNALK